MRTPNISSDLLLQQIPSSDNLEPGGDTDHDHPHRPLLVLPAELQMIPRLRSRSASCVQLTGRAARVMVEAARGPSRRYDDRYDARRQPAWSSK